MLEVDFLRKSGSGFFTCGFCGLGLFDRGRDDAEELIAAAVDMDVVEGLDSDGFPHPGGGFVTPAAGDGDTESPGFPHPGGGFVTPAAEGRIDDDVVGFVDESFGFPHPGGGFATPGADVGFPHPGGGFVTPTDGLDIV